MTLTLVVHRGSEVDDLTIALGLDKAAISSERSNQKEVNLNFIGRKSVRKKEANERAIIRSVLLAQCARNWPGEQEGESEDPRHYQQKVHSFDAKEQTSARTF